MQLGGGKVCPVGKKRTSAQCLAILFSYISKNWKLLGEKLKAIKEGIVQHYFVNRDCHFPRTELFSNRIKYSESILQPRWSSWFPEESFWRKVHISYKYNQYFKILQLKRTTALSNFILILLPWFGTGGRGKRRGRRKRGGGFLS